jgi:hypothetical protein
VDIGGESEVSQCYQRSGEIGPVGEFGISKFEILRLRKRAFNCLYRRNGEAEPIVGQGQGR